MFVNNFRFFLNKNIRFEENQFKIVLCKTNNTNGDLNHLINFYNIKVYFYDLT